MTDEEVLKKVADAIHDAVGRAGLFGCKLESRAKHELLLHARAALANFEREGVIRSGWRVEGPDYLGAGRVSFTLFPPPGYIALDFVVS